MKYISKRPRRNTLVAHLDGKFSVRIDGRWRRRISELSSETYLSLLRCDRERLVLREFETGVPTVTGSRVIVQRHQPTEALAA